MQRLLAALGVVVLVVVAPELASARTVPGLPPGQWHLTFDDEFSNPSQSAKLWGTTFTGHLAPQDAVGCYVPSALNESGGILSITASTSSSNGCGGYQSGIIYSQSTYQLSYGYVEARIYVPDNGAGGLQNWPAFWMTGQDWPTDGEIDVLEGLGGPACGHFHYGSASNPQQWGFCSAGDYSGWHVYAADWEPGSITWYYDGREVGRYASSDVTSAPEWIVADEALTDDFGGPGIEIPSTMQIDWIRVYQH